MSSPMSTETRVKSVILGAIVAVALVLHVYKLWRLQSITAQNTVETLRNYFAQVSNISAGKFHPTPYQNEKMNALLHWLNFYCWLLIAFIVFTSIVACLLGVSLTTFARNRINNAKMSIILKIAFRVFMVAFLIFTIAELWLEVSIYEVNDRLQPIVDQLFTDSEQFANHTTIAQYLSDALRCRFEYDIEQIEGECAKGSCCHLVSHYPPLPAEAINHLRLLSILAFIAIGITTAVYRNRKAWIIDICFASIVDRRPVTENNNANSEPVEMVTVATSMTTIPVNGTAESPNEPLLSRNKNN